MVAHITTVPSTSYGKCGADVTLRGDPKEITISEDGALTYRSFAATKGLANGELRLAA